MSNHHVSTHTRSVTWSQHVLKVSAENCICSGSVATTSLQLVLLSLVELSTQGQPYECHECLVYSMSDVSSMVLLFPVQRHRDSHMFVMNVRLLHKQCHSPVVVLPLMLQYTRSHMSVMNVDLLH